MPAERRRVPVGVKRREEGVAWRLVNTEAVELVWRIRSLQFFGDEECTQPYDAITDDNGAPLSTSSADMTGAEHVFMVKSMRGWESAEPCGPGACHLGFAWQGGLHREVKCLVIQQGEDGFHADAITLQRREPGASAWSDVVAWGGVPPGRSRLAVRCPSTPAFPRGKAEACQKGADALAGECGVRCDDGFAVVEPRLRCVNGVWYVPECVSIGSMVRLVAREPELMKPYWVVLDAALFADAECTEAIQMHGNAFSSGEYVIKYASYHPKAAWDGDKATSWASKEPCTPGSCHLGFRFGQPLASPPLCVIVEHPPGRQYHATSVSLEVLGAAGWEEVLGSIARLLPELHGGEL